MSIDARVLLWGRDIGAVTWLDDQGFGVFQYTSEFAESQIEIAPLTVPLRPAPYQFPSLSTDTPTSARKVELDALISLANRVLDDRIDLRGK